MTQQLDSVRQTRELTDQILDRVNETFVGDRHLLEKLLAGALANGHVLFEDHPGLGKTLLVKVFGKAIGCDTKRVQFTPDLLPADILGTKVWHQEKRQFELQKGPIFTNVLLADEINRAPPKTQSALLEAMEERQVTIEGDTMSLGSPFFVLATQNPIEQEGTYPLPEAQMDRFLLRMSAGYPTSEDMELEILTRRISWHKDDPTADVEPVTTLAGFRELQERCEHEVFVDPEVLRYITRIVRAFRENDAVTAGPSPRGCLALLRAGRALALIRGRDFVTPDDVKALAVDALAHRVVMDLERTLEGYRAVDAVREAVKSVEVPARFARKREAAATA